MSAKLRDVGLVIIGAALVACAHAGYNYYGISAPEACYGGATLLSAPGGQDLPFSVCRPDAANALKCPIMLKADFDALVLDKDRCHADLVSCEQRCPK